MNTAERRIKTEKSENKIESEVASANGRENERARGARASCAHARVSQPRRDCRLVVARTHGPLHRQNLYSAYLAEGGERMRDDKRNSTHCFSPCLTEIFMFI